MTSLSTASDSFSHYSSSTTSNPLRPSTKAFNDQSVSSCILCKGGLQEPRVLPCSHRFCLVCLQGRFRTATRFNCPTCDQRVILAPHETVEHLTTKTFLYPNLASISNESPMPVTTAAEAMMHTSLNGNASDQYRRLRQPLAKSPDMNSLMDTKTNGPNHVNDAWPMQNNREPGEHHVGGEQRRGGAQDSIWNSNSLFDFSPIVQTSDATLDAGWQSLQNQPVSNGGAASWSSVVGTRAVNGPPTGTPQQPPPGFGPHTNNVLCTSCDDKRPTCARCKECAEDLCEACAVAHKRVKAVKDHHVEWHTSPDTDEKDTPKTPTTAVGTTSSVQVMSSLSMQPQFMGGLMTNRGLVQSDVLQVYKGAVEKAKADSKTLITNSIMGVTQIEEAKGRVDDMKARVDIRCSRIRAEITANTAKFVKTIQERESILLGRLDKVRSVKIETLDCQKVDLTNAQICLRQISDQLRLCIQSGREMELINATNKAMESMKQAQDTCGNLAVHEDDVVDFALPDPAVLKTLSTVSFVGGSGFADKCLAEGDGLKKGILGKDSRFIVVVKDHLNEQRSVGGEPLNVNVLGPDGRPVRHNIFDGQNGTYRIIWKPTVEGDHIISVTLKNCHIQQSPFKVKVRSGRNYAHITEPLFTFGIEGENDGQLCRPWGVCCTPNGNIIVANRSNNRIEVFGSDGTFKYNFGKAGKGQGEFERPASVACDRMHRLIVADKDNHRIQIFTVDGKFLQMFGEKGSKAGQFNYPWDVACSSTDYILVSDTRNHRIQLFSPSGDFVKKYGFEGREWKHFDSPRGVCFAPDDKIITTDFNNHRLLVVQGDLSCAQYLGKEGTEDGMFVRPNGVAVDEEGNIIVADSRNDRVQVFTSSGVFISKFGAKGTAPGEFDRPCGVCISPDGHIIVVDFANNRVQVF